MNHILLIGLAVLVVLLGFLNWGGMTSEGMENKEMGMESDMMKADHEMPSEKPPVGGREEVAVAPEEEKQQDKKKEVMMSESMDNYAPASGSMDPMRELERANCYPQAVLKPNELLPGANDVNQFSEVYPEGQGNLMNKNFLQAGFNAGIDTVGQTLRNANLQLRSEPPNPQVKVSPWNQTTIDPDLNRRPLEIGGCA